jgi:abhydrolase domain-containing protein 17
MNLLGAAATGIFLAWAGLALFALLFAKSMIFPVPSPGYGSDFPGLVFLETEKGETIAGRLWDHPQAHFTILFSHGNGEDLGRLESFAEELRAAGFAVFAYDYPGYGLSTGRPGEASALRAVRAAWDFLTQETGIPPERILLHGRSLGGGPSLLLAKETEPAGIILESTFVSTFRVLTRIPLLPWDIFDNLQCMKKVSAPILILHGEEDETVPVWHAERLAAADAGSPTLLIIPEAGHNNLRQVAGPLYEKALREFATAAKAKGAAKLDESASK